MTPGPATAFVEEIGHERNKVLIVDDFLADARALIAEAAAMAPFEAEDGGHYPGIRRSFGLDDGRAGPRIRQGLESVAPLIGEVFGLRAFNLLRMGFYLVTRRPEELSQWQRLPHIDQADPRHFALLHFLSPTPKGGTNFYRHRGTGFERISPDREPLYAAARKAEMLTGGPPPARFFNESDRDFERTAYFEGKFNRLLVYRGSLLHSGYIPPDFAFSPDPVQGRLTCNIFVEAQ